MNTDNLKAGDVAHVRATVKVAGTDSDGDIELQFKGGNRNKTYFEFVHASEVVHIEPRPLQADDKVTYRDPMRSQHEGEIEFITANGLCALVNWPTGHGAADCRIAGARVLNNNNNPEDLN